MSRRSQIFLIWWTIGFMLMWGLSYYCLIGMDPPPPATLSAQQVANIYITHRMNILVGATLCAISGAFMGPLTAVVSYQMARLGKGFYVWAVLQAGGGFGTTIFIAFPSVFWGVAAFSPDRPPEITKIMHELAFLTLVTTVQLFSFQLVSIACVCYLSKQERYSAFPRWLGHFTVLQLLIAEMGCAGYLSKTGPLAWNGFWVWTLPNIVYFPWILAIGYAFWRTLKHQEAQDMLVPEHQIA